MKISLPNSTSTSLPSEIGKVNVRVELSYVGVVTTPWTVTSDDVPSPIVTVILPSVWLAEILATTPSPPIASSIASST